MASRSGVDERDEMNKEWLRLVMRRKSFGLQATLSEAAKRMFFIQCINIFRILTNNSLSVVRSQIGLSLSPPRFIRDEFTKLNEVLELTRP